MFVYLFLVFFIFFSEQETASVTNGASVDMIDKCLSRLLVLPLYRQDTARISCITPVIVNKKSGGRCAKAGFVDPVFLRKGKRVDVLPEFLIWEGGAW